MALNTGFKFRSGGNTEAVVDQTGVQVGIEYAHDAVHRDVFVTASERVADFNIASPRVYLIVAPAAMDIHFVANIGASGGCLVDFYKAPTTSANGTALQTMRHKLNSSVTTTAAFFHTPTKSADGTLQFSTRIPGESGGNPLTRIGGSTRSGQEIVLSAGNKALLIVTSETDNAKLWASFEYYEVAV